MVLQQDNPPVLTAHVTVAEAVKCGFELPSNTPYSTDLTVSDFLFPKFKSHLCNCYFENNNEVMYPVVKIVEFQNATFFRYPIAILDHYGTKCIDIESGNMQK